MNWGLVGVLICGIVSFLLLRGAFWLYKLDKKEAEGVRNLGRMGTPPDSFTITGNPSSFILSIIVLCSFIGAVGIFGYLFRDGVSINYSLGFVLAVLGIGTLVLIELRQAIINFCIFFKCRIRVEELQFFYTDWLGRIHTFDSYQVTRWRLNNGRARALHSGLTVANYSYVQYKDPSGKKHRAVIGLSTYTEMLLSRYLHHYCPDAANRVR